MITFVISSLLSVKPRDNMLEAQLKDISVIQPKILMVG